MKKKLLLFLMAFLAIAPCLRAETYALFVEKSGYPADWANVYAHLFNGSGSETSWPGIKMSMVPGSTKFYYAEYESTLGYNTIIINQGNDDNKSPETSFSGNNKAFWYGNDNGKKVTDWTYSISYEIYGPAVGGWSTYKTLTFDPNSGTLATGEWYLEGDFQAGQFVIKRTENNSENHLHYGDISENQEIITDYWDNGTQNINLTTSGHYKFVISHNNTTKPKLSFTETNIEPEVAADDLYTDWTDAHTVYFNAGADYNKWKLDGKTDLYVYYFTTSSNKTHPDAGTKGIKMNKIDGTKNGNQPYLDNFDEDLDSHIFYIGTPNITGTYQVAFSPEATYPDEGSEAFLYRSNRTADQLLDKDKGNASQVSGILGTYIYGPGNSFACHQSYLTFKDFKEYRANKGENGIYFIGTNVTVKDNELKTVENGQLDWSNFNSMAHADKHFLDLYIVPMTLGDGAKFKVSYINPHDKYQGEVSQDKGTNLRWWATFNLGVIGPDDYIYDDKDPAPVGRYLPSGSGDNKQVDYNLNNTISYNHFNQYDWAPTAKGDVYFIVDTDKSYKSVCLLGFEPTPSLTLTDPKLVREKAEFTDPNHQGGYNPDDNVESEVTYPLVNNLFADMEIQAAKNSGSISEGYEKIQYTLMRHLSGKGKDAKYQTLKTLELAGGTNEKSSLEYFPYAKNVLCVQAVYTDKDNTDKNGNQKKFRTLISSAEMGDPDDEFDGLVLDQDSFIPFIEVHNYGTEEGKFDLVFLLEYKFGKHRFSESTTADSNKRPDLDLRDNSAAIYPAFDITVNGKPAFIIPENYPYINVASSGARQMLFENVGFKDDASTNWAIASAMTSENNPDITDADKTIGHLPLYVPGIFTQDDLNDHSNIVINATVYARYPFRIHNSFKGTSAQNVKGMFKDVPAGYYYDTFDVPTTETATFSVDNNISGITNVTVEGEAESFELFNLQGVRVVEANPAPGIYIRRAADGTASKVVIR